MKNATDNTTKAVEKLARILEASVDKITCKSDGKGGLTISVKEGVTPKLVHQLDHALKERGDMHVDWKSTAGDHNGTHSIVIAASDTEKVINTLAQMDPVRVHTMSCHTAARHL